MFDGFRSDIQAHHAVRNRLPHPDILRLRARLEFICHDVIQGQEKFHAFRLCLLFNRARQIELVILDSRLANMLSLGLEERVGHGATDDQRINFGQKIFNHSDLVANLGATQDCNKRLFRVL